MWVKICGTTTLEDALLAVDAGADAVGFVFAPSKRQVTPEQVAVITPHLPAGVEAIGVFTSVDIEEIAAAAEKSGLSGIQLHSPFDPAFLAILAARLNQDAGESAQRMRLVQVVDVEVSGGAAGLQVLEAIAASDAPVGAVLLDSSVRGASGGTGIAFSWERAAAAVAAFRAARPEIPVILAGGLRPENVREAIALLQPDGVDVVSGVESAPGRKDAQRVAAFVKTARGS